jgi:hypothetical protein
MLPAGTVENRLVDSDLGPHDAIFIARRSRRQSRPGDIPVNTADVRHTNTNDAVISSSSNRVGNRDGTLVGGQPVLRSKPTTSRSRPGKHRQRHPRRGVDALRKSGQRHAKWHLNKAGRTRRSHDAEARRGLEDDVNIRERSGMASTKNMGSAKGPHEAKGGKHHLHAIGGVLRRQRLRVFPLTVQV